MKKYLFVILSIIFTLCSCEDKESWLKKNPVDPNYEEYAIAFKNEFGEIDSTQSWDFYSMLVNSETRANSNFTYKNVNQPSDIDFTYWQQLLKSGENNSKVGTHQYSLISNGSFFVYPCWYAGWYEIYAQYNFELGIYYNGKYTKLFNGCQDRGQVVQGTSYSRNPNLGAEINIPKGSKFQFYIRYTLDNKRITMVSNQNDCSTLLYSNNDDIMVIGFEDTKDNADGDYNDVILYLKGNTELPIVESKRFMCEDLGSIGDFDFNDVVFDVQPYSTGKVKVTIQACGGTLPIDLYVNDAYIGEVHSLLGVDSSVMVNTGTQSVQPYSTIIDVPQNFDISDFNNIKLCVHDNEESYRYVTFSAEGKAPCILATPISTRWVKETINIKLGYPNFFTDKWYSTFDTNYLYY